MNDLTAASKDSLFGATNFPTLFCIEAICIFVRCAVRILDIANRIGHRLHVRSNAAVAMSADQSALLVPHGTVTAHPSPSSATTGHLLLAHDTMFSRFGVSGKHGTVHCLAAGSFLSSQIADRVTTGLEAYSQIVSSRCKVLSGCGPVHIYVPLEHLVFSHSSATGRHAP